MGVSNSESQRPPDSEQRTLRLHISITSGLGVAEHQYPIWVVVKVRVPLWVLNIIRPLVLAFRGP